MTKECPKCGKKYSDEDNFCESCGKELIEFKEKPKEIKAKPISKKPNKWIIPAVSLVVVAIAVVLGVFWFYGGMSFGVACNKPYIKVRSDCCLDQNDNRICDSDETTTTIEPIIEKTIDCSLAKIRFKYSHIEFYPNGVFSLKSIENRGNVDLSGFRITIYEIDGDIKSCDIESSIRSGEVTEISNVEGDSCTTLEDIIKFKVTSIECPEVEATEERTAYSKHYESYPDCYSHNGDIWKKWCQGVDIYGSVCRNGKWVDEKLDTCSDKCFESYFSASCG